MTICANIDGALVIPELNQATGDHSTLADHHVVIAPVYINPHPFGAGSCWRYIYLIVLTIIRHQNAKLRFAHLCHLP
ncbi:hypothetical protein MACH23_04300 [Sulfitobacter pontiacus]|nr:hypothetical protein MACH23_04300 [Sulfitobacter pontiacus]